MIWFKVKGAITNLEHRAIVAAAHNPKRRASTKKAQFVFAMLEEYAKRAAAASAIVPLPLPAVP